MEDGNESWLCRVVEGWSGGRPPGFPEALSGDRIWVALQTSRAQHRYSRLSQLLVALVPPLKSRAVECCIRSETWRATGVTAQHCPLAGTLCPWPEARETPRGSAVYTGQLPHRARLLPLSVSLAFSASALGSCLLINHSTQPGPVRCLAQIQASSCKEQAGPDRFEFFLLRDNWFGYWAFPPKRVKMCRSNSNKSCKCHCHSGRVLALSSTVTSEIPVSLGTRDV